MEPSGQEEQAAMQTEASDAARLAEGDDHRRDDNDATTTTGPSSSTPGEWQHPAIALRRARMAKQMHKYRILKRALRGLVYEQEVLLREFRKEKRKILHLTRKKHYVLDRLLQYDDIGTSESDDALLSSEEETTPAAQKVLPNPASVTATGAAGGSSKRTKKSAAPATGNGAGPSLSDDDKAAAAEGPSSKKRATPKIEVQADAKCALPECSAPPIVACAYCLDHAPLDVTSGYRYCNYGRGRERIGEVQCTAVVSKASHQSLCRQHRLMAKREKEITAATPASNTPAENTSIEPSIAQPGPSFEAAAPDTSLSLKPKIVMRIRKKQQQPVAIAPATTQPVVEPLAPEAQPTILPQQIPAAYAFSSAVQPPMMAQQYFSAPMALAYAPYPMHNLPQATAGSLMYPQGNHPQPTNGQLMYPPSVGYLPPGSMMNPYMHPQ
ncbi:hypothetical protein CAOG_03054 [Capsaspora owczarzaki ATCC 30864]|nr:hypothetical protein CAOG_03054 [Capsaspora owczarzaki ATCC 30864]|eukprot:XP_004363893.2 hypothetical protein CAOG_03054 [Capsaspora owczarzaki ATCC 30864]